MFICLNIIYLLKNSDHGVQVVAVSLSLVAVGVLLWLWHAGLVGTRHMGS